MEQEKNTDVSDVVVQASGPSAPDARTASGYAVAPGLRNYGPTAAKIAEKAFSKARLLSGWRKWLAIAVGTLAAAAGAWLMTGCAAAVKQDADGICARWVIVLPVEK